MKLFKFILVVALAFLVYKVFAPEEQQRGKPEADGAAPVLADWSPVIAPPLANNTRLFIDLASITPGTWHDKDGKYCWTKFVTPGSVSGEPLQVKFFFEKHREFYAIVDHKSSGPVPEQVLDTFYKPLPFNTDAGGVVSFFFDRVYPGVFDGKKAFGSTDTGHP